MYRWWALVQPCRNRGMVIVLLDDDAVSPRIFVKTYDWLVLNWPLLIALMVTDHEAHLRVLRSLKVLEHAIGRLW